MSKLVCKEIQSKTSGIVIPVEDLAQLSQTLEGMRSSGISSWVDPQTSGYNYAAKALVWFDNNVYQLNVANSIQDPTGADWSLVDISNVVQASQIAQTTGDSDALIMSQKAVTNAVAAAGGAPAPSSATYEYDALSRVDTIITPDGTTVIGYNLDGTVETITYPTGRVETFTYDISGNVISMTAIGGEA